MRLRFVAALLLVFCATSANAHSADIAHKAATRFIIPAYESFTEITARQAASIEQLCRAQDDASLQNTRATFRDLVLAWSRIEIVRFGPVTAHNRLERILFWPDRKSTGLKQVQSVLVKKDETAIEVETLTKKSVALQGLTALEYTLFGSGAGDLTAAQGAYRCAYAHTIAKALHATGAEIVSEWRDPNGIVQRLSAPKPDYADYRDDTEVLQELLGIFAHGAELIRDTRLLPFFSETPETSRYKRALFWRSGLTLQSMAANVQGMRDLFVSSGFADLLQPDPNRAADAFVFELDNFIQTANTQLPPLQDAVRDDQSRSTLNYLSLLTNSLQDIATDQIAAELGLSVGFSSLDGD